MKNNITRKIPRTNLRKRKSDHRCIKITFSIIGIKGGIVKGNCITPIILIIKQELKSRDFSVKVVLTIFGRTEIINT